jgi:hypothetical protein
MPLQNAQGSVTGLANPLVADLDGGGHAVKNAAFARRAVADANTSVAAADDVIAYTALTGNRIVTIDPTILVLKKLYTVVNESQSPGKTFIQLHMASGSFDGAPDSLVAGNSNSVTFFTPDGVNVHSYGANIIRSFLSPASGVQCLCIGCNSVTASNVDAKYPYIAQYATFFSVDTNDCLALYDIPGSGFPEPGFAASMLVDLSFAAGLMTPYIFGATYRIVLDCSGYALYGPGGATLTPVFQFDDAMIGFFGASPAAQQANTVGPATALRTLGLIAAAGNLYPDLPTGQLILMGQIFN